MIFRFCSVITYYYDLWRFSHLTVISMSYYFDHWFHYLELQGCVFFFRLLMLDSAPTFTLNDWQVHTTLVEDYTPSPTLVYISCVGIAKTSVKFMFAYLKDPSNKKKIICDEKLKELLDVDSFIGFTVTKLLAPHFIKAEQWVACTLLFCQACGK